MVLYHGTRSYLAKFCTSSIARTCGVPIQTSCPLVTSPAPLFGAGLGHGLFLLHRYVPFQQIDSPSLREQLAGRLAEVFVNDDEVFLGLGVLLL